MLFTEVFKYSNSVGASVMSTAPLLDGGQQFAFELYHLLREIDPIRWRDEFEQSVKDRWASSSEKLEELLESHPFNDRMVALREALAEIERLYQEHSPAEELPPSQVRAAWMSFRVQVQPAYETLAARLKAEAIHVPSLRPTNYQRSIFHVFSASMVVVLIQFVLPLKGLIVVAGLGFLSAWTMEISRRYSDTVNRILMRFFARVAHPHERYRINSSTWYTTALLILALMQSKMTSAVAVAVLGIADPVAAFVGRRWGKVALVNGRSLEGTLAFIFSGFLIAFGVLRLWYQHVPVGQAALIAFSAAALGGLAELFSKRIDDNMSIPVSAAVGAWATAWLLGITI
jgi:dolichol kinase